MIEEVFEQMKNDSRFIKEKRKILAFEIFNLVLFPNLTGIIGLEMVASFLSYKNTQINLTMAILA
jgi:hypothetical protein